MTYALRTPAGGEQPATDRGACASVPAATVVSSLSMFVALVVIDGDDRDYVVGMFGSRQAAQTAADRLAAAHPCLHAAGTAELVTVGLAERIAAAHDAMAALDGAA